MTKEGASKGNSEVFPDAGSKSGLVMWVGTMMSSLWASSNVLVSDQGLSVSWSTISMP